MCAYDFQQTFLDDIWFMGIASRLTKKLGSGRVLDIGCGNGRLLHYFDRLGWNCCGVDTSPWSKKASDSYGFELFEGTIESKVGRMGKFDLVVSTSTLEHIAQPIPHIETIAALLNKGGGVYLCGIPNYASRTVRLGLSTFHGNRPPGHVNFFTPATLQRLFRFARASFRSVTVRTYGIPELYSVYNALMVSIRKQHVLPARNALAHSPSSAASFVPQPGSLRKPLSRFAITAFYHIGRIASAGDKLEVMAIN